ncbi:hypothetical protein ElyMa_006115600 [Elysia marginata]|uniref:Uncharacterized protein n=1 Tax=Elysia marginata TaxID=1093978 RepID=A0AAV4GWN9_9GAST|nr:hypothetical protein ElyMa_006115600 [Elysia marginata]
MYNIGILMRTELDLALCDTLCLCVQVERSIGLRPSTQRGPFPDDFLTFPGFHSGYGDLTSRKRCQVGDTCTFTCSAVGGFMTDLQVNKLSADGDWEHMTDTSDVRCHQKTVKRAYYTVCQPCATAAEVCAKCNTKQSVVVEPSPSEQEKNQQDKEIQFELRQLKERERRAYYRSVEKGGSATALPGGARKCDFFDDDGDFFDDDDIYDSDQEDNLS